MRGCQPVRASLRAATAAAHERVDRAYSAFELDHPSGYGEFLEAQAAALLPLEDALEAGAAPRLPVDWAARRRSAALHADLRVLGRTAPQGDELPPLECPAAALGTLYVLEGSRLGGAVLKRAVPPGLPTAFLTPRPAQEWQDLLAVLESRLPTPELQSEAIGAALAAFGLFERSALSISTRIA